MKKTLKVLVALLALAAAATPALAFENQISGAFTAFGAVSNFKINGLEASAPTSNWIEQRARFYYTAKADENVKLVSKFELDYSFYGNSSFAVGRNQGGAIGADSVQVETKNLYLDWSTPSLNLNTKIGMMGYDDAFSGIIFSTDMAGVLVTHSYPSATASVGFFRWNDSAGKGPGGAGTPTTGVLGQNTQDLFVLDAKCTARKDLTLGAAYYYISDDEGDVASEAQVHTLGVNAAANLGAVTVNGFLLGQFGDFNAANDAKGYAAKLAAKTAVGPGTLRADLLYVAGGDNQLYVTRDVNGYYDNEMVLLSRDKYAFTNDVALVNDLNNNGEGVIFASLGFDQSFSSTLSGSANLGFAAVADNNGDDLTVDSGKDYIGTELNYELDKKVTDNLTLIGRAAYVFLGDRYLGDIDNPYSAQVLVAYRF